MIDSSIYRNAQPAQFASPMDFAQKAMTLSGLAKQNQLQDKQDQLADKQIRAADLEAEANALNKKLEQTSLAASLAMSAKDQPSYEAMLGKIQQMGVNVSNLPAQYDPNYMKQIAFMSMKAADRLQIQKAQLEAELQPLRVQKMKAEISGLHQKGATPKLSVGEQSADRQFGKDASEYYYGGGKASVEKNLSRLQGAIDELNKEGKISGGFTTKLPGGSSDYAQDVLNPKLAQVRDDIRGAIQASLRQVLGAQFTEKEAQAIFNRAFNPRLSDEENIRRATQELNSLRSMAEEKDRAMRHFASHGTTKGFSAGGTGMPGADQGAPPPKSPKPGTVDGGYVYMGGDPGDPKSWKRTK